MKTWHTYLLVALVMILVSVTWVVSKAVLHQGEDILSGGLLTGGVMRAVVRSLVIVEERLDVRLLGFLALILPRVLFKGGSRAGKAWIHKKLHQRRKNKDRFYPESLNPWHLIPTVIALALIFGFAFRPAGLSFFESVLLGLVASSITVLIHKLGHLLVAIYKKVRISFQLQGTALAISIAVIVLFQELFSVVGELKMDTHVHKDKSNIVIGGILANLVTFSFSSMMFAFFPHPAWFFLGLANITYAVDNLFPIHPIEGHHIWKHSKFLWAFIAVPAWILGFGFILVE